MKEEIRNTKARAKIRTVFFLKIRRKNHLARATKKKRLELS